MSKWTQGTKTKLDIKEIEKHALTILRGVVLVIDPASKSLGWAIYRQGKLDKKGTIVAKAVNVNTRLIEISRKLEPLIAGVDVLAIEKIRGSRAHDYLKWSIGMVISTVRSPIMVEVPISLWKQVRTVEYTKTDENDAEMIGIVVMTIAKEVLAG